MTRNVIPFPRRTPEQCPSVVSLLSESYNPHVRCGAAMALGICCAGTGNKVRAGRSRGHQEEQTLVLFQRHTIKYIHVVKDAI